MSQWTYVRGMIEADVCGMTTSETRFLAETATQVIPKVTGSERDMAIYVTIPDGPNASSSTDMFNRESNLHPKHGPWFESQTKALLTLHGNLRDRDHETTLKELTNMLKKLATWVSIDSCIIAVYDSTGKSTVINNPEYLRQIEISDRAMAIRPNWNAAAAAITAKED